MPIKCTPLGAGQDVGKSCVVVNLGGKTVMFDCGVHMGYQDERRYPDFSMITKSGNYTQAIDCVIVTHFHLDHIGALPYFTEVCGYEGPVYMTYPTKALAPLMLEDYRKVMVDRKGEQEQFSAFQIQQCIKKVIPVDLRQTVTIDEGFELRGYYAGHVLGAAMFYVRAGDETVVYTGDYNMTPDRHLGAAQIDRLRPDLLITESTYATTIRDSKLARERDFLKAVHSCISAGGKVLIPVFALGRAQELCILLDEYWERTNLKAPIYFSAGLTMQANVYYKLLISWTNQKVKDTYVTRNTFDFKHVSPFERSQIDAPGPCVLFATPGMLSGGLSLEVFKHWAPSELNMIILPGFCVAGTVGYKLMSGKPTRIDLDKRTQLDVRCQVNHLSFSAHTDAKGIMDLAKHVAPRHVVLVHGEKPKMVSLKGRIITELNIPCYDPANHETINIPPCDSIKVSISKQFLLEATASPVPAHQHVYGPLPESGKRERAQSETLPPVQNKIAVEGLLVSDSNSWKQVLHPTEVAGALGLEQHRLRYSSLCPIYLCPENETDVDEQLPAVDRPMEVSEFPRRMYEPSTTIQNLSSDKEAKPEPEQKRSKKNLQRVLSLDLERLPEAEEGDDICLDLERAPSEQSEQRSGSLGAAHSRGSSSNVRIDLDINVVPDLTLMDCSPRSSDSPEISSSSILHGVYLALAKWMGHQVTEQIDSVKGGRTLSIRISPQPISDSGLDVPGRSDSSKPIAIVECTWEEEDDHLAQRAVSILHGLKFKPE